MLFSKGRSDKGLKGQTEYIIILGMLVIAVVIGFVVSQTIFRQEPANVGELKGLLKADVERLIQSSAVEVTTKIGKSGGYLDMPADNIQFSGGEVPYWGVCQNKFIPSIDQIENNIKAELQTSLAASDFSGLKNKYGKDITIDQATKENMDLTVRDDDMILDVYMPTKIEGFDIQQPYRVVVPVPLGKTYDFASKFIEDNSQKRYFETFTSSLFYHSNENTFPTSNLLTKCGEFVFKTFDQLKEEAQKIADFSLSNVHLWSQPPPESQRTFLDYYIPDVGNKTYPDLDIKFYRAADLDSKNFQPSQNPVSVINSKPINKFVPKCLTSVDVDYSLGLPIVASVKSSGGFEFNFGLWSFIDGSKIGKCQTKADFTSIEDSCSEKKCHARLKIADGNGNPVPGTQVSVGPCLLGVSGQDGIVSGSAPCGISEIVAYNPEYSYYYNVESTLDLDKTITLKKSPAILFNFNTAPVTISDVCSFFINSTGTIRNDKCSYIALRPDFMVSKNTTYSIGIQQADTPVYLTFTPKKPRPWSPVQILVGNVVEDDQDYSQFANQPTKDETYSIEANVTITYADGTEQSGLSSVETSINLSQTKIFASGAFPVTNNLTQSITKISIRLDSAHHYFIPSSNSTNSDNTFFSVYNSTDQNQSLLTLSWSNTTQDGFIKSFETRTFSSNIGIIPELQEENGTSIPEKKTKTTFSRLIDFLPADNYTVEVRTTKNALFRTKFCRGVHWYGGCKGYKTIEAGLIVTGISNIDLEVKDEEKEIFANALVPSFTVTRTPETDYYYNDLLPKIKANCNFSSIGKSKSEACQFTETEWKSGG